MQVNIAYMDGMGYDLIPQNTAAGQMVTEKPELPKDCHGDAYVSPMYPWYRNHHWKMLKNCASLKKPTQQKGW